MAAIYPANETYEELNFQHLFYRSLTHSSCRSRTGTGTHRCERCRSGENASRQAYALASMDQLGAFRKCECDETGGVYRIKGEQKGRGNDDFVTIDGVVKSIDEKEFVFDGKIVTRVSHIAEGAECKREGEFTFRITGKRKYWRLMQMDNPCDPVTDYVDIYFR